MAGIPVIPGAVAITPVGSRVTCSPCPRDADEDFLVLVSPSKARSLPQALMQQGWDVEGDGAGYNGSAVAEGELNPSDPTSFMSLRKLNMNLILTANMVFHDRFLAATHVAKRLNLIGKDDRISLFQAVLYGATY